jgi:hypothetical protein
LFDAGKFVSTYKPLGSSQQVADDSTLHCGDCHTVGQWKPFIGSEGPGNYAMLANGTATTVAIGAHGANSEYMLRNDQGTNALGYQQGNTAAKAGLVCYLCHVKATYSTSGHNSTSSCLSSDRGSVGLVNNGALVNGQYPSPGTGRVSTTPGTSNSSVFGISCVMCHNSGQQNGTGAFGGIHGSNATYLIYSGATSPAHIVSTKSYRFMGGLTLKYTGGKTPAGWEKKSVLNTNREGCYNIGSASNQLWTTNSTRSNVIWPDTSTATDPQNVQVSGGWGSCNDHIGSATAASGTHSVTRDVQRPLSY